MNFNFNQSRVKCSKLGFKVHVVKALIGMKENRRCDDPELDVLAKAVDYIKALEREVVRLESGQVVNITNSVVVDPHEVAEVIQRGFLSRMFGGVMISGGAGRAGASGGGNGSGHATFVVTNSVSGGSGFACGGGSGVNGSVVVDQDRGLL